MNWGRGLVSGSPIGFARAFYSQLTMIKWALRRNALLRDERLIEALSCAAATAALTADSIGLCGSSGLSPITRLAQKLLISTSGCCVLPPSGRIGSSDSEVVVVQCRVEQQKETPLSLVPPHRVVREHHYVAFADWNIDYRSLARKLRSAGEHSADQQLLLVRVEAQHYARPHVRRRNQSRCELPELFGDALFAGSRWLYWSDSGLWH